MTITTKKAKNGAILYYANGKRICREDAMMYQRQSERLQKWEAANVREAEIAAIDDYAVSVEAQDAATDAEIELANSYLPQTNWVNPYVFTVTGNLSDNALAASRSRLAAFNHKQELALPDNFYLDDFNVKLAQLQAKVADAKAIRDAKQAAFNAAKKEVHVAQDALDQANDAVNQLFEQALQSFPKFLVPDDSLKIVDQSGQVYIGGSCLQVANGTDRNFQPCFMIHDGDFFASIRAIYYNPEHVKNVIVLFNDAIMRGASKFKFPTADELNQPSTLDAKMSQTGMKPRRLAVPQVNAVLAKLLESGELFPPVPSDKQITDSLIRAMETCLLNIQAICLTKPTNLSAINREWELYQICNNALLRKEVA